MTTDEPIDLLAALQRSVSRARATQGRCDHDWRTVWGQHDLRCSKCRSEKPMQCLGCDASAVPNEAYCSACEAEQ